MSFIGFRGPFQSFMQKDFIASHPIDMSTFTADVQPDGTWNILNIQSTDAGGQVLETQNVTKCAAMICNPNLCNVLCARCPVGSPCLHEYVCSCHEYTQRSCCAHIHAISVLKLDKTRNVVNSTSRVLQEHIPNDNNAATNVIVTTQTSNMTLSNFKKDNDVISKSLVSSELDFQDCKTSAFKHLTAALCFVQNLKSSSISQSLCVNLVAAISRFSEIPIGKYRVTKYCTNAEELPDFERATLLVKNEKGIKNRVPIWQEKTDIDEFVSSHNDTAENKENAGMNLVSGASIKIPQINLKQLPNKLLSGHGLEEHALIPRKKKNQDSDQNRKILGRHSVRINLLKEALHKEVHEHSWIIILSQIEKNVLALANFSETEREVLMKKMVKAKSLWSCAKCDTYQTSLILGGYVECHVCNSWFHILCCNNLTNENGEDLNVEFDEDFYLCDNCSNLVIIDTQ